MKHLHHHLTSSPKPVANGAARPLNPDALASLRKLALALFLVGYFTLRTQATVIDVYTLNADIPDGGVGMVNQQTVVAPFNSLTGLEVDLHIIAPGLDGGYNGDLYVTLAHGSGFTVLLNRPGRRAGDDFGYDDGGLNVTFADAGVGDIHQYRKVLYGNNSQSVPGGPTGLWQPDARLVDPDLVLDSSPRTSWLGSFQGLDPNGLWVLYAADLSPGGQSRLISWGLRLSGTVPNVTAVPEPKGTAMLLLASLGALVCFLKSCRRK